jgi:NDP-sugar pyrophosphorylase family protein
VNHLVGYGIGQIVLSVGYMGEVIEGHFENGVKFGCEITYVREDASHPLGTGGPLAQVSTLYPDLDDPVLILNGDLVTQFDASAIIEHHEKTRSTATVGAFTYTHEIPYGVLSLSAEGTVEEIIEKPTRQEPVSGGIYVLDPSVLRRIPPGRFVPMTEVLSDCIARGDRVTTWTLDHDWIDVGQPQDLAKARGQ